MSAERQLEAFIDRFLPEIAAEARLALEKMRTLVPGAREMVYDNYNALAIGFGPNERASNAILSIVVYPRYVTLFFLRGASLPDPDGIFQGNGKVVRHVRLASASTLDDPALRRAIALALELAPVPIDPKQKRQLEIRAVCETQLPRRPRATR